jgi:hypothetical protein
MRLRDPDFAWVVYERHAAGKPKMTAMCSQPEWDAMQLVQPNPYVLIQAGITNEGEAERLARTGAVVVKEKVARPKPVAMVFDVAKPVRDRRHYAMGQFLKHVNQFSSQRPANVSRVSG